MRKVDPPKRFSGRLLKKYMKEADYTIQYLAEVCTKLGYPIHRNSIRRAIEQNNTSTFHLMGFSEALDRPLEDFFEDAPDD